MIESRMVETSQLQTLIAVAQTQSFSKAAEELQVTQSAISQSVKNLETKVGVAIFKRSGKQVVLTPEGEQLYTVAKRYLAGLEDVIVDIQNSRHELIGNVRLGTLSGLSKSWMFNLCLEFSKEHPDLFLSYRIGPTPSDLVEAFERYFLDVIIVPESEVPVSATKYLLFEEKLTLVYPKNPAFEISPEMDVESFSKLPLVLYDRDDSLFRFYCRQLYGAVPHRFNKRLSVNSHTQMLLAVSQGLGVAVMPTHVIERTYLRDELSFFGVEHDVLYKKFYLVHHKEMKDVKRIQILVERILRHFQANMAISPSESL